MNQIDTVKKICGILMAGGTAVLLFMISDLMYKAWIIGADALDAAIHIREKKDKRLLLYTGISNGIYGLHGMLLPVAAAATASVIFIRMNPVKTSVIKTGQTVQKGDVPADAACTKEGILALGHNPVVAFMCWDGYNFEDAITVSEKLIREDKFTSIDIMRFEAKASYTEAGLEEITRDIPRTDSKNLAHLDERGIAKIGTVLKGGDIIIGKVSPRREDDSDDEISDDISLKDIFGEKASKYKDTSVRLPKYMKAAVIDVKVFTHEDMPEMDTLTEMIVRVTVAKKRKLEPGDKMSGRHGNKGVVAVVVPEEDMPYMEDGILSISF